MSFGPDHQKQVGGGPAEGFLKGIYPEGVMNLTQISKNKLGVLVRSGAINPIVLVQEKLVRGEREHSLQKDVPQPVLGRWPQHRYLYDMTARIWQEESRCLGLSHEQYFRLKDQIEYAVFGEVYRFSPWGQRERAERGEEGFQNGGRGDVKSNEMEEGK